VSTPRLKTLLGDHPVTEALKQARIATGELAFDFADVKVPHTAFKRVVRELEFDVAELAIMTFLLARAHGKPLKLLPAVLTARFQHPFIVYNAERGPLDPAALEGRRVGQRSYSVTTATWIPGDSGRGLRSRPGARSLGPHSKSRTSLSFAIRRTSSARLPGRTSPRCCSRASSTRRS
jgi:hypothetical protein